MENRESQPDTVSAPTPAHSDVTRGTASPVIGICPLFAGWMLIAPLIGLWLGISSRRREPAARTRAAWGIGLNALMLILWVIIIVIFVAGGGLYSYNVTQ